MELKLTKKYSTKTIRAVLIMFMEMLDSILLDYDFFYEYTGLDAKNTDPLIMHLSF